MPMLQINNTPHPYRGMEQRSCHNEPIPGDECACLPCSMTKFSRFRNKDKSDYTFINYMYAAAATYKDNEYFGPNRVFRPIFRSKRTIRRSFPQKSPLNFANSRNVRIFAIPKPIEPPRSTRPIPQEEADKKERRTERVPRVTWSDGRVVRHSSAKADTAVQIRFRPQ